MTENNQRVTNAQIFAKLEVMNERLKKVEKSNDVVAQHSIRCGMKWDQYEKDQKRISERLGTLEEQKNGTDKKQVAKIGGVVAIVVAIINFLALIVSQMVIH